MGDTRYAAAAPVISRWVNSDDKKLAKLTLFTLARIGNPSSEPLLARAAEKSGFVYDVTGATEAYLEYARQLAASGKSAQAEKIARQIQQAQQVNQVQNRTRRVKNINGSERRTVDPAVLTAAMDDKDPQYRATALQNLRKIIQEMRPSAAG